MTVSRLIELLKPYENCIGHVIIKKGNFPDKSMTIMVTRDDKGNVYLIQ